ncbi:TPA: hypothetical protein MJB77_25780 [Klebsiella pneumoniae]|nr:hypothetical protein [Klebsiella pneumoniae]HBZ0630631.1 hypothetical protein [Klebsiella pneumoniae]HCI5233919.1 hypothetical protein [Klebsiella pneumoniae]
MVECILCGDKESTLKERDYGEARWYSCQNCGDFLITYTAERKLIRNKQGLIVFSDKSKQCREAGFYLKIWNDLDQVVNGYLTEEQFKAEITNK